jgi:hypothetical protein
MKAMCKAHRREWDTRIYKVAYFAAFAAFSRNFHELEDEAGKQLHGRRACRYVAQRTMCHNQCG